MRAAILHEICATPGVLVSALALNSGFGRATIRHHVARMARAGLVNVVSGRQRCAVFPTSMGVGQQEAIAALKRGRTLELVRHVVAEPGVAQVDLTSQLNLSRKLLRKYVDCLLEHRLVEEVQEAPYVTYYPTPQLLQVLTGMDATGLETPQRPGLA